ncbi:MAG: arylesterase [Nitrosomonadales bacterium]|nr:MAG: arylesterase [Nitrosomonadales bacterium]
MLVRCLLIALMLVAPSAWAGQTILVFGDSLSANYGIASEAGWVSLLQQRLDRKPHDYRVVNASISGETTAGGISRIHAALDTHQPDIVIIELGANDGLRGLSLEATRNNLDGIMLACRTRQARILLIGMRLPPNYGAAYTEGFAALYPALAKKHRAALLPFLLDGIADRREWFQADNLHPTAAAQAAIMENVWAKLQPLLKQ